MTTGIFKNYLQKKLEKFQTGAPGLLRILGGGQNAPISAIVENLIPD